MGDVIQTILNPEGGPVGFPRSAPRIVSLQHGTKELGIGHSEKMSPRKGPSIMKTDQMPHREKGNTGSADQGHLIWC